MLANSKLNSVEVLIYKALMGSIISLDEFVLANNLLNEYDNMKEEIKNIKTSIVHRRFCNSKKPRFIKEQEASGFLSNVGIKTSLSRILLLAPLLF